MAQFTNSNISAMTTEEIAKHVASSQKSIATAMETYRKKTRKEHAVLMLEGRTLIKTIEQSVSIQNQAELLTRHQINAATQGVSSYTPWIKLLFGKHDADGKTVKFGGQEHVKWMPDTSYARYMNFYEVIDRDYMGPEDKLLEWVLEKGGPSVIVEAELKRKRDAARPSTETVEARRALYLAEADLPPVMISETAISSKNEFVGVILQKTEAGFRLIGVNKEDASADFERLAATQFAALSKAKTDRETLQEKERQREEDRQRGSDEQTQRIASALGMKAGDIIKRLKAQQAEKAKTTEAAVDQQVAD